MDLRTGSWTCILRVGGLSDLSRCSIITQTTLLKNGSLALLIHSHRAIVLCLAPKPFPGFLDTWIPATSKVATTNQNLSTPPATPLTRCPNQPEPLERGERPRGQRRQCCNPGPETHPQAVAAWSGAFQEENKGNNRTKKILRSHLPKEPVPANSGPPTPAQKDIPARDPKQFV